MHLLYDILLYTYEQPNWVRISSRHTTLQYRPENKNTRHVLKTARLLCPVSAASKEALSKLQVLLVTSVATCRKE
jgi:hypothetical protein